MAKNDFLESIKKAAESKEGILEEKGLISAYIAKSEDESGIDPRIITYYDPRSSIAESYRAIFTHLRPSLERSGIKTIAVMSASTYEGKSITAVNLSVVMAKDFEKKVLLVDANLRQPVIDELVNVDAKEGLSDILSKDLNYNNTLASTKIENLKVITAGANTVNPVELVSGVRMSQFLNQTRQDFDYIVLDTPAIIPYADSKILVSLADGAILTIRARKTRREIIDRTQSILDKLDAKILGFVLTDVEYYIPEFIYKHL